MEGIQKDDKIGIVVYQNRPEWVVVDLAIQYIGAISVPMYPTISSRDEYIMNEAEVKLCFVGSGDLFDKVHAANQNVPTLKKSSLLMEKMVSIIGRIVLMTPNSLRWNAFVRVFNLQM